MPLEQVTMLDWQKLTFPSLWHAGNMQDPEIALDSWDAVLEAATTLVESNLAYRQQACMHPWVRECLQHDQTQQTMSLQMFLLACQG